jgi:GTP-binding protein HflX
VFNKTDALEGETVAGLRVRADGEEIDAVFVSAVTPSGLDALTARLGELVRARRPVVRVRVPIGDGRTHAELHRTGEILTETTDDDAIIVTARLDAATTGRLRERGVHVSVAVDGPRGDTRVVEAARQNGR